VLLPWSDLQRDEHRRDANQPAGAEQRGYRD
jgi:hypothetical protein